MNAITIAHLSDIHHNPDENSQISTLLREKGLLVEKLCQLPRKGELLTFRKRFPFCQWLALRESWRTK